MISLSQIAMSQTHQHFFIFYKVHPITMGMKISMNLWVGISTHILGFHWALTFRCSFGKCINKETAYSLNPGRKGKYFTEVNVITFKLKCVIRSLILQHPVVFKMAFNKLDTQTNKCKEHARGQVPCNVLAPLTVQHDATPAHLPTLLAHNSNEKKIPLGYCEEDIFKWGKVGGGEGKLVSNLLQYNWG